MVYIPVYQSRGGANKSEKITPIVRRVIDGLELGVGFLVPDQVWTSIGLSFL